ncbi:MAG TPA: aminodeoxychorismate/anthranilate synthase component II [Mycobacteriales bacterium]|jgi:para-aminobenzoate synthetase component 2|nr:aminodeoxychorismate/anthranilate synthase component II [Mycobacteriales bacterium]
MRPSEQRDEVRATRIAVIDNYDSFVYNIVQYLGQLGAECVVRRNDEVVVAEIARGELDGACIDGVLLSPGPGTPERAGICVELLDRAVREAWQLPMLGVCLGHQALGVAVGATVRRAPELLHGKTSQVHHTDVGVLAGLPNPFTATRYHSLAVEEETLGDDIEITARSESGVVMAMRHRRLPLEGVQFHPESVLTQHGHALLANWLEACGNRTARGWAAALVAATESRRLSAYAA